MMDRNFVKCPRCHVWDATEHIATPDGYQASCVQCLTPDERAMLDRYRLAAMMTVAKGNGKENRA